MTKIDRDFFVRAGRKGGKSVLKKRGKDYLRKLAKKGGRARWAKSEAATA